MNNPTLVYRTTDPKALSWLQRMEDLAKTRHVQVQALADRLADELGSDESAGGAGRAVMSLGGKIIGIMPTQAETDKTPKGWRIDKNGIMVPHKATLSGKAWQSRLDEVPEQNVIQEAEPFGIPQMVFTGTLMYTPGMDLDKDGEDTVAIYQLWTSEDVREEVESAIANTDIVWESVPLSEWYLRQESKAT